MLKTYVIVNQEESGEYKLHLQSFATFDEAFEFARGLPCWIYYKGVRAIPVNIELTDEQRDEILKQVRATGRPSEFGFDDLPPRFVQPYDPYYWREIRWAKLQARKFEKRQLAKRKRREILQRIFWFPWAVPR